MTGDDDLQATPKVDDGWILHQGGARPNDMYQITDVKFRDGTTARRSSHAFAWDHTDAEDDIVAYRLVHGSAMLTDNKVPAADTLTATLVERGSRYGVFTSHAEITQKLKRQMHVTPGWDRLDDDQRETLDMVAHKIGRILNGDPNYADSWVDIAGYAKLISDRLEGVAR